MASIEISNSSRGWLVVWLEPLGEDRWLGPGETFTIRNEYEGPRSPFTIEYWSTKEDHAAGIENLNCWVNEGDAYAEVLDGSGTAVECGHQRPPEIDQQWRANRRIAEEQLRLRHGRGGRY